MNKMHKTYTFFDRFRDEMTGEWVYTSIAVEQCDSDAQAELMVNHLRDAGRIPTDIDGNPQRGLTIRRGDIEWYSSGV